MKRLYARDVLQEWKERYGNTREDYTARNRSSHEMKETSYSDAVPPSNNRRKFLRRRIYERHSTSRRATSYDAFCWFVQRQSIPGRGAAQRGTASSCCRTPNLWTSTLTLSRTTRWRRSLEGEHHPAVRLPWSHSAALV